MAHDTVVDQLNQHLAVLRAVLLGGRIGDIAPLVEHIETATGKLDIAQLKPDEARTLRQQAKGIEVLLRAATAGLSAARQRVEDLAEARRGIGSYDRKGQPLLIPAVTTAPIRRL